MAAQFTKKRQEQFLKLLAETANVAESADLVGIDRSTAYLQRKKNPEFAADWDDAIETAVEAMEAEAYRRAVKGTNKPVFHKGEECGVIKEYSDTLLIFLLKAHRPQKYIEKLQIAGDPEKPIEFRAGISPQLAELVSKITNRNK